MKKIMTLIMSTVLIFVFFIKAQATEIWYEEIFDALSSDVRSLLEDIGITEHISEDVTAVSPEKALKTVFRMLSDGASVPFRTLGLLLALIFITTLLMQFLPEGSSFYQLGKSITLMIIMFSIISVTGDVFTQCASALLVTKDLMLVLIPIFTGIVSMNGNPALALSFNTVAFSFAELTAMIFNNIVPGLSAVLIAICSAGAVNQAVKLDGIGRTLSKAINLLMAFIAGIFVAVLSVRGVIAGAADSVTVRGLRFLIGNTVPVVGSAIGEALNSIVAGLGLIKNTSGMIGIAAIAVINLPPLINAVIWKLSLFFLSASSDITDNREIKSFSENMNGILSVIIGAIFFVCFVFMISIAILITVGRE